MIEVGGELDAIGPIAAAQIHFPDLDDRGADLAVTNVGGRKEFRSVSLIEIGFGRSIEVVYEEVFSHDNLLFGWRRWVSDLGPRGAVTRHPSKFEASVSG